MEQQIIDTLNQYISQNPGYKLKKRNGKIITELLQCDSLYSFG